MFKRKSLYVHFDFLFFVVPCRLFLLFFVRILSDFLLRHFHCRFVRISIVCNLVHGNVIQSYYFCCRRSYSVWFAVIATGKVCANHTTFRERVLLPFRQKVWQRKASKKKIGQEKKKKLRTIDDVISKMKWNACTQKAMEHNLIGLVNGRIGFFPFFLSCVRFSVFCCMLSIVIDWFDKCVTMKTTDSTSLSTKKRNVCRCAWNFQLILLSHVRTELSLISIGKSQQIAACMSRMRMT